MKEGGKKPTLKIGQYKILADTVQVF
jgi:hypothetical protein